MPTPVWAFAGFVTLPPDWISEEALCTTISSPLSAADRPRQWRQLALRQQGFDGEIHLFSDEPHLPYERPPLSKTMLLDDVLRLRPVLNADWWRDNNVQLHLGVTVQTLGRETQTLVLADGQTYPWDQY